MKRAFMKICLLIISLPAFSQLFHATNYPAGYFSDPLDIPIRLVANFGELRANHYHMGLDIRTEKRVNLPVHAAADGYIARIKIEPEGFGQAIYINHPNGYTTLYAHLNSFFPALSAYVKKQQYKTESWQQTLDIPAGMFPVTKGQLIALSGSTGGSEGPHLHFEIRRTADDVNLNPMLFGLPIPDDTKPVIQRLAIYDGLRSIYEQTPQLLAVKRNGDAYSLDSMVISINTPRVGFAIAAFDTQSGSANPNGIFEATLYDNNHPVSGFQMDNISYNDTRNVNAHIDYKTKAGRGPYLQQLFRLPGYTHSIYQVIGNGNGMIDISDRTVHDIRIEVKDVYGNASLLNYKIQLGSPRQIPLRAPGQIPLGAPGRLPPQTFSGKLFYPMMLDGYEADDCAFYIGEKCLYDSVHIQYNRTAASSPNAVSAIHSIGAVYIPLQDPFLVRIKANINLPADKKNKVVMEWFHGAKKEVHRVQWQGDWASSQFRSFGNFQLVLDEEPPIIMPRFKNGANLAKASAMSFVVSDNFGEYKNVRAELDGKWLLFTNDKGRAFIYKFDEHCPRGKHELKISAEDEAGNKAEKIFTFTR